MNLNATMKWRWSHCQFLTLMFFTSIGFSLNAQYSTVSSGELEAKRIENIKSGNSGDKDIYNELIFSFEEYEIFEKNYLAIEEKLKKQIIIEFIELDQSKKQLKVIYPLEFAKTNDFLKSLKETFSVYGVYIATYSESLLMRSN